MSEWPKELPTKLDYGDASEYVEVIPAGLGRELYGAILAWFEDDPDGEQMMNDALARYEREVGKP